MNTKIIRTLMKKELLDVIRDKKTVVMMLVIPVILYPLIFVGAMQVMMAVSSGMEQQSYRAAVNAQDNGELIKRLESKTGDEDEHFILADQETVPDYETALQENQIDVYVTGSRKKGQTQYEIYYLSSDENSSYAAELVQNKLDEMKTDISRQRAEEAGLSPDSILEPVICEWKDVASSEQSLGSIMGSILPLMLVISLLMGTMYPAIDTTAGERERGTLETMLTLPVTNHQLITAKFLTVAAIGIVSALLNVVSMGGIACYIYQILDMQSQTGPFDAGRFLPALLVSILAVFAFSLFISAVTMCVTSFAKSYKEANNYITPLMLVILLTGYIGFIPNIELTQTMSLVPVANICLLIKNLMLFQLDLGAVALVLISNVSYAVLAVLFLSRVYDSEAVLFGDSKSSFQIFEKRSSLKKGGVPSVSDAWLVIAVTILLVLYAGSILQIKYGIKGVFGTQMILLAVPLVLVFYTKKDLRQTYGFYKPAWNHLLGAAVLACGFYLINIVLSYGMCIIFPESASRVSDSFAQIMDGSLPVHLFVIALTPAVCEEMLFRGVIFQSMRAKYRITAAMGLVAVLFGIYHMSIVKLIPTGLLGLVLCYVAYGTGSIFPAMLMHFLNNAVSVVISEYPKQAGNIFPWLARDVLSVKEVIFILTAGLLLSGAGVLILRGRCYHSRLRNCS